MSYFYQKSKLNCLECFKGTRIFLCFHEFRSFVVICSKSTAVLKEHCHGLGSLRDL
jgi:hypothetical protein